MVNTKEPIKHRYELVFLYDVRDANPNGDPDDSNKPRIDENTGENIVTDVRLKRTIRDYWKSKNIDIFVKPEDNLDGTRKSMDRMATDFVLKQKDPNITDAEIDKLLEDAKKAKKTVFEMKGYQDEVRGMLKTNLPEKYLDVRAFGGAITLKSANTSLTGSAQFGLGRSLNKPTEKSITITSAVSSGEDKGQGTIGSYQILDYSLIRFRGIASEINAKSVSFSEEDLQEIYNGLWLGTNQLNTRSKFNHSSRFLFVVKMKSGKSQIGDLDLGVSIDQNINPKSIDDVKLDISQLVKRVKASEPNIENVLIKIDPELKIIYNGNDCTFQDAFKKSGCTLKLEEIKIRGN